MAIPDVRLTIKDGALGILPEATEGLHVKLGVSSGGTATGNVLYSVSDLKTVKDYFGQGPLVEALDYALTASTNGRAPRPIYAMRVTTAQTPTVSAVSTTRVGTSTGTVATTGTAAYDAYDARVEITRTGTLGAGAFKYSLDYADTSTFSQEITIPSGGTYVIPDTGITIVFAAGGGPTYFEAADRFTFTTTPAAYTTGELATAFTALMADAREWGFFHVVGAPANASATASLFDAVATHVATAEAANRYVFAVIEAADDTDNNLISAMALKASTRVMVGAGWEELFSSNNGRYLKRPSAWPAVARIAAIPIHEDPARFASGPLVGVAKLYRDEFTTQSLDAQRFTTLRTHLGQAGTYVTNGRMFAAAGSDFTYVTNRRVLDKACSVARGALLRFLNESVRVDATTGYINELDARGIEAYVEGLLRAAITQPGSASDVSVQVSRVDNILSTQILRATIRVTPLGYAKQIEAEIGFYNPALQVQAA